MLLSQEFNKSYLGISHFDLGKFANVLQRSYIFLKDNSTMYKTAVQIVSYGILYLNPSFHQCLPSYKKYNAVYTPPNRHTI